MFTNRTRFCYENHLLSKSPPHTHFFNICVPFMDTFMLHPHPHRDPSHTPSHMSLALQGFQERSGSCVLVSNPVQCSFLHNSPEQSRSEQPRFKELQVTGGTGNWGPCASISTTAVLSPELGVQHPGSPGEKLSSERPMQQARKEH